MPAMTLSTFAPYPTTAQRTQIPFPVWDQLLESWTVLAQAYTRLSSISLKSSIESDSSVVDFLRVYFCQLRERDGRARPTQKELELRKQCFLLVHRILLDSSLRVPQLLAWQFLADLSHAFLRTQSLHVLFDRLWAVRHDSMPFTFAGIKCELIQTLASKSPHAAIADLERLTPLVHASPQVGAFLMTGSDLIDALYQAYASLEHSDRQRIVVFSYLCLSDLHKSDEINHALLIDHLYSLRSQAGPPGTANLLCELITNTSLLEGVKSAFTGKNAVRADALIVGLLQYNLPSIARPRRPGRPHGATHKDKQPSNEQHVHRMSLISQIEDLFPDLGSGFVARLLDEYEDNVERVTSHLLDQSLPPHLASLDRSAALPESGRGQQVEQRKIERLAPHAPLSTPIARRNIYDDDELDRLEVDASRLHIGRREGAKTVDEADDHKPSKTAILAALAAFDSDDDERDDTYDAADVGDTVDAAHPDGEEQRDITVSSVDDGPSANDKILYSIWKENRDVLGRTADVKRSQARRALRNETGMSDEMIEGWAVMVSRDAKMQRRLETATQTSFAGEQNRIERTAYRNGMDDGDDTGTDGDHPTDRGRGGSMRGSGRGRGRGRGRGGRGGGGDDGTSTKEPDSAIARRRKDQNKASRANHNRRDQRGKKMARAGFPG